MSVNSLLFKNSLDLNAKSINLSGIASGLIKVAPIITTSNILCDNLYVERSKFCDQAGNIAVPSGPFTITNAPIYNYVLTGIDSSNASWQELPVQEPAQYLQTDTTAVKIYGSNAPSAGDVLIALSATEAEWGPQSGGSGSNVASFLDTSGAPVNVSLSGPPSINQVLKATSATTAIWGNVIATNAAYANVAGYAISALHSQWSDDANIALTALTANVAIFALDSLHSDWADVANVAVLATNAVNADHAEWADFANLSAFAVDSTHTDWADFANSIANTTVTPGHYGDATHVGRFVVNASGQLTQAANVAISFPAAGNLTGPVTSVGLATTITATGVSAQKYGNATSVPTFIVNTAGQLTQAANVAISFPAAGNLTGPITSVGLATSIASQTGTGSTFVVQNTPTLTTPNIGAATGTSLNVSGQLTSTIATGTAPLVVSSTTNVPNLYVARSTLSDSTTTNANLTGVITSVGNATSIASQTGTGSTFVVQNTPTLTTPVIGSATGTSLNITGQFTTTQSTGTAPLVVSSTTKVANLYVDRSALADTVTTNANLTGVITSVGNATSIAAQTGTGSTFVVQTNPSITNPTISQITNTGVLTLPTTTDTLIGRSTTDSLTNKTLTDNSNNILSRGLWCNSGTGSVSTYASTNPISGYVLTATGVSTATWQAAAAGGPTFPDNTFSIYDSADNTKQIQFDAAGTTSTKTTITSSQTVNRVLTLPDLTDTLIGRSTTDTLTNKGITDASNNVIARGLWNGSGTGSVSSYTAAAPTTGQILAATNSTTMTWQSLILTPTSVKTASYTAISGDIVLCDTNAASGDITITLPASPSNGNTVRINLVTEHATRIVSIARNGSSIDGGTASQYELYHTLWKNGDTVTFQFVGGSTGWAAIDRNIRNRFVCFATKSAAQNNVGVGYFTVQLDSETYDYNSNYNTGTYAYTVPITGLYSISISLGFLQPGAAGGIYAVELRNATPTTYLYSENGTANTVSNVQQNSRIIALTAAEVLTMRGYSAVATADVWVAPSQTFFSIALLSRQ